MHSEPINLNMNAFFREEFAESELQTQKLPKEIDFNPKNV